MTSEIRTRIAPSPTGEPHVGTAYIALFNVVFARKYNGKFILRIEDTDQTRSTNESEKQIYQTLKWLGLGWDEGPGNEGEFGPYRQSERLHIYKEHIEILLQKKHAYRCFCQKEDLEKMRKEQLARKETTGYFGSISPCRNLSQEEITKKIENNTPYVIRMAIPNNDDSITFFDEIRQETISKPCKDIDDQIILKSDGFPTYHLASVVDDHLMKISHVIRGEEWINSTYKHVLLYRFFEWQQPKFFHLGLLRNPDANKTKISKRKNPVSLRWFRAAGYHPQALLNFLGLMGYSRYRSDMIDVEKKTCEQFDLETMISDFDENKISATGAAFDFTKLEDLNFHYTIKQDRKLYFKFLKQRLDYLEDYLEGYLDLFLDRYVRGEKDIVHWSAFLFKTSLNYKKNAFDPIKLESPKSGAELLRKFKKVLSKNTEKIKTNLDVQNLIQENLENLNTSSKKLHMILRVAVTGAIESLPLYDSILLLGPYRTVTRLEEAATFLASQRN